MKCLLGILHNYVVYIIIIIILKNPNPLISISASNVVKNEIFEKMY